MKLMLAFGCLLALAECGEPEGMDGPPATLFPCGGGTCLVGSEVCVDDGMGCTKCASVVDRCEASDDCACIEDAQALGCADTPVCEPSENGLRVVCEPLDWGCD